MKKLLMKIKNNFIPGLICFFMLLFAINSFIRVSGPITKDRGILTDWVLNKVEIYTSKKHAQSLLVESLENFNAVMFSFSESINNNQTAVTTDTSEIVMRMKKALKFATLVSNEYLDKTHPDLRHHFRDEYQAAIVKMLQGIEFKDERAWAKGGQLWNSFKLWFEAEKNNFIDPATGRNMGL